MYCAAAIAYALQNIIAQRNGAGEAAAAVEPEPEPAVEAAPRAMAGRKCPECGALADLEGPPVVRVDLPVRPDHVPLVVQDQRLPAFSPAGERGGVCATRHRGGKGRVHGGWWAR